MFKIRRKLYSQNFLHSHKLVASLVGQSSIGKTDLVIEIGPGKGIITEQLAQRAGYVIAVEIDGHWCQYLDQKYGAVLNLSTYQGDFLNYSLPKLPYKVFANVPFAIEGKIIRKLIEDNNPPADCYLVVMKSLALRLSGQLGNNMFVTAHGPWFDFSLLFSFQRSDFSPPPSVDSVLFNFKKKLQPLLTWNERKKYRQFVNYGFGNGGSVFGNLLKKYGVQNTEKVFQKLSLSRKIKPGSLSLQKWILLYQTCNQTF